MQRGGSEGKECFQAGGEGKESPAEGLTLPLAPSQPGEGVSALSAGGGEEGQGQVFVIPPLLTLLARRMGVWYAQDALGGSEEARGSLRELAAAVSPAGVTDLLHFLAVKGMLHTETLDACLREDVLSLSIQSAAEPPASTTLQLSGLPALCPSLRRLNLEGCNFISPEQLHAGLSTLRQLTHVCLSGCALHDGTLQDLLHNNSKQLRRLDASWCTDVTDGGFEGLAELGRLKALNISGTSCTEEVVSAACSCPALQQLLLDDCSCVETLPAGALCDAPHLTALGISAVPEPSADALQSILEAIGPRAVHLGLSEMPVTAEQAALLAQRGPLPLQHLELSWCEELEADESLILPLLKACPDLRYLAVRTLSFGDAALTALAQACPQLRELQAGRCEGITDAGLATLALGCRHITTLDISWSQGVGDDGLRSMLELPALTHLTLGGVKALTKGGITAALAAAPCRHQLRVLDLSWVNAVDADTVAAIQRLAPFAAVTDYYTDVAPAARELGMVNAIFT